VAPPDRHLVVADRHIRLLAQAKENGHRPSADVLLRSVARVFGDRAAGVVLSGTMDDGAAGLRAIAAASGLTLVQDPEEASFPGMPLAAIAEAHPQFIGPVVALANQVCEWVAQLPGDPGEPSPWTRTRRTTLLIRPPAPPSPVRNAGARCSGTTCTEPAGSAAGSATPTR
jgi:two-component system chemotaxis response regulator CheB